MKKPLVFALIFALTPFVFAADKDGPNTRKKIKLTPGQVQELEKQYPNIKIGPQGWITFEELAKYITQGKQDPSLTRHPSTPKTRSRISPKQQRAVR